MPEIAVWQTFAPAPGGPVLQQDLDLEHPGQTPSAKCAGMFPEHCIGAKAQAKSQSQMADSALVQTKFQQGQSLHQRGMLAEAERLYVEVLLQEPRHFHALHLLGLVFLQTRRLQRGVESIAKAVELSPTFAAAHNNLGSGLNNLRRHQEALASCDRAIALKPDYAEAYNEQGIALKELKRPKESLASYDKAIALKPGFAEAYNNRGNVLWDLGRSEAAVSSYNKAIALKPDYADTYCNRGVALSHLKRHEEALASFDKALALNPNSPEIHSNRGAALWQLNRYEEALASYDKALALNPNSAETHNNRGVALNEMRRHEEALASFEKALALQPNSAETYNNRGAALKDLKRLDEAIVSYGKATQLNPEYAEAHYNRSLAEFLVGNLTECWRNFEWRKKTGRPSGTRTFPRPLLTNLEDVRGKTILVHTEQGLGDTIQFCRYLELLRQAGAKVLFAPHKKLKTLLTSYGNSIEFVDADDRSLSFDFHTPLMSLPRIFETTLETIPSKTPYLFADSDLVQKWLCRLGKEGFRVGICWKGGSTYKHDNRRSFSVAYFEPLSKLPGIRLISLHKGEGERQLMDLADKITVETLGDNFDSGPDAFIDSAAVMKGLDLVITSDTSIAHLAGALDVPTWVALQYVPDWRWMLDRLDTPWYPTMRLFRQKTDGDWKGVFEEIKAALVEYMNASPKIDKFDTQQVPISWGELIDKITILEIKEMKLTDANALANVKKELELLSTIGKKALLDGNDRLIKLKGSLSRVNKTLWDIECRIRIKEKAQEFDEEFIGLARSVYQTNDQRAAIKREINLLLSSELFEEKSYQSFGAAPLGN
jgi:tetratricopeptide (TPR) repeat protein